MPYERRAASTQVFVEIAQSRSISRAAERLRVAQPALSQNVSSLPRNAPKL